MTSPKKVSRHQPSADSAHSSLSLPPGGALASASGPGLDSDTGLLVAAKMGHEINNVAHALQANLKTLKAFWDTVDGVWQARVEPHENVNAIRSEMPHLLEDLDVGLRRIGHIVATIRAYVMGTEPHHVRVDLATVVGAAFRAVESELAGHAIELGQQLPLRMPAICGDEHQLVQVLVNLLMNAIHALKGREGERRISVSVQRTANRTVQIRLADTGGGIQPEVFSRLFQPFVTTRRGHGGTGLGLFISREILTRHGGSLTVHNRPGQGATFILTLPLAPASRRRSAQS